MTAARFKSAAAQQVIAPDPRQRAETYDGKHVEVTGSVEQSIDHQRRDVEADHAGRIEVSEPSMAQSTFTAEQDNPAAQCGSERECYMRDTQRRH
jgi:hypothetical protein